ncbi:Conserved protein [Lacticaseibacillus rhamnosus GG]|nr:Conserved protein [Lacticaseibacillus rhamnosus GG]CAR89131.1 Conserved protein [Lacticaseibacillus rhamnosus Lc 705]CAR86712.1 Conserved protein [Lacticaseibacillus rhamnosus GG]CAR86731.1 Conserved protein [Lacticaseibacillus rhamnosus GG]CAR88398.1 Conserved protein [Lacticaseibacillus rhamnosus GG]
MYSLAGNTLMCTGFPHSEISGSKLTYSSPKHIGISSVLHRLLVPRHPPCALCNLTCTDLRQRLCDANFYY